MTGPTVRLYTAAQVRQLDALAIETHGIAGYTLMTRAGEAVVKVARERFPAARRWLVLCGGGNNGGDGYVAARLAAAAGIDVHLVALKPPAELSGDAAQAAQDWQGEGGAVHPWPPDSGSDFDLVIDAMLGTGLDREVGGRYREAVEWVNRQPWPCLAVDVPSGLNADTGTPMGCAVEADVSVSFIGQKRGLYTADGPDHAGEVRFETLQTPFEMHQAIADSGTLIREYIIVQTLQRRARNAHKGHFGHVLVAGGIEGMGGAPRLCGEAALRAGAGLVSVATHPTHAAAVHLGRPELMVHAAADGDALQALLQRATVIALGPGLGQQEWSRSLWAACIDSPLPLVVDADGLNLLAGSELERDHWILTPHPAEAARLLACETAEVQADRVAAALELARRRHATIVLKGCGTVVADPTGRYGICSLGNPGMATAGTGDVLTGVVAALLAQGLEPMPAAMAAVAAHAAAGDLAAEACGERGLLAGDITRRLPRVLNP